MGTEEDGAGRSLELDLEEAKRYLGQ